MLTASARSLLLVAAFGSALASVAGAAAPRDNGPGDRPPLPRNMTPAEADYVRQHPITVKEGEENDMGTIELTTK